MEFKELSLFLEKLEKTSSRNEITLILSDLFHKCSAQEIDKIVYLLTGRLAPNYEGLVFNVADKMMIQVIALAYSKDIKEVQQKYKELGDIGTLAESYASSTSSSINVTDVYGALLEVAREGGEGSQERRIILLSNLLKNLDRLSVRYVARIPLGKLRLGFSDKTIIDALSWMERGDKSGKRELEMAYQVLPDVGLLANEVKTLGISKASQDVVPRVGVPVQSMLAQRLKSPADMIKKMKKVVVEPKLDGLRVSIHFKRGRITKAYTRNLNEVSWMFPELENIGEFIKGDEVILDTEAVGVDEERKAMANFQSTMTRRRKHDIDNIAAKIGIKFYVFDILLKDGTNLLDKTYSQRREVLEKTIKIGALFEVTEYHITEDPKKITELNVYYRKKGLEGIMVKKFDSDYVPGRAGWRWVKMKEAETALGKLSDTVDVVIMGYYKGRGKRTGFGLGGFLAGVTDGKSIKTVTKVGTGLSDDQFRELKTKLDAIEVNEKPIDYEVADQLVPDVWVKPSIVVELAGDDITKSPNHSSGLAIRFPRLVKFRDDKDLASATTTKELNDLYKLQYS